MKRKTEKWESLRLEVQSFAPQEFIAACWVLNLWCDGFPKAPNGQYQDHIFQGTMPNSYSYLDTAVGHEGHFVGRFTYQGDEPPTMETVRDQIHEFPAIVASISALNHGGQDFVHNKTDEYSIGYTWPTIPDADADPTWNYCFVENPVWELQINRPNAS
jgi:hypothetical protein